MTVASPSATAASGTASPFATAASGTAFPSATAPFGAGAAGAGRTGAARAAATTTASATREVVTIVVAGQTFGIPVLKVQDVLRDQTIARVPLAPPGVAGSLNLRGRIVTAIDVRTCLGIEPRAAGQKPVCVVVEKAGDLYSLLVDRVGDVLALDDQALDRNPATLDPHWREVASGIFRLPDQLIVLLDSDRLLAFTAA